MSTPRERISRKPVDAVVLLVLVCLTALVASLLLLDGPDAVPPQDLPDSVDREGSGSLGAEAESLAFTITGDAEGAVSPGVRVPLDLSLVNPHQKAIAVRELTVSVDVLEAPNAGAELPCTVDDFTVTQFSGPSEFVVPAATTTSLSDLDVPMVQWPEVGMHDLPENQDGCKGAALKLLYTATGLAVSP